jgi:hypothetical protein
MHRIAMTAVVAVLVSGCGASAPPKRGSAAVEPASSGAGYDFRSEGQIPPPAGGGAAPETDVEEIPLADSSLDVAEAQAPRDTVPASPSAAAPVPVDGFRIQVFASADRDVAENARVVAAERLGMPAYLDLDGGVYKVRVGDFPTREEANRTLPAVRSRAYADAWIVPAKVPSVAR